MSTKFLKLAEIYDHSDQNQNIDCLSLLDLPCQLQYISLCGLAWSIFNGDPDFNIERNILVMMILLKILRVKLFYLQMLNVISNWLIALNSAINFFIYCLAGAKFRQVTKLSQGCPQVVPKIYQSSSTALLAPRSDRWQSCTQVALKLSHNCPQFVSKLSPSCL